ncbi:MAG: hypothetical protein ACTSXF_03345, partial [Promethearchaeota archaeon]
MKERSRTKKVLLILGIIVIVFILLNLPGILWPSPQHTLIPRSKAIPKDAVKITPDKDQHPPILNPIFSSIWENPVPMEGPINTAGLEDSPYITPDGKDFYFWFKPDPNKDIASCLNDGSTGIYRSHYNGSNWSEPERVFLGWDALDACPTFYNNQLWFCSIRNNQNIQMYVADYNGTDFEIDSIKPITQVIGKDYHIGELHIIDNGTKIFFGSVASDGLHCNISMTEKIGGVWQAPVPIDAINTQNNSENLPFVSSDGKELWFTRSPIQNGSLGPPDIYRSVWNGSEWGAPQKVVESLVG